MKELLRILAAEASVQRLGRRYYVANFKSHEWGLLIWYVNANKINKLSLNMTN